MESWICWKCRVALVLLDVVVQRGSYVLLLLSVGFWVV